MSTIFGRMSSECKRYLACSVVLILSINLRYLNIYVEKYLKKNPGGSSTGGKKRKTEKRKGNGVEEKKRKGNVMEGVRKLKKGKEM